MASNQKENSTFKLFSSPTFNLYNLNVAPWKMSFRRSEVRRKGKKGRKKYFSNH